MASPQDRGIRNEAPGGERQYRKEYSVYINVGDNKAVKPQAVIEGVNELTGKGQLYGCVPKSGNMYVLTFKNKTAADYVLDGVQCGGKTYPCKPVKSNVMDISFMNVDIYVPDEEIISRLEDMKMTVIGDVRRIHYANTDIENGNRVCRVKVPPDFVSLPYLMKLSDGEITGMYRVIHDNQRKICNNCHQEGHLFRTCPNFLCRRCNQQGHFERQCTALWCQPCFRYDCGINHEEQKAKELVNGIDDTDDDDDDDIDDDICDEESDSVEICETCDRHMCICKNDSKVDYMYIPSTERTSEETVSGESAPVCTDDDVLNTKTPVENPTQKKQPKSCVLEGDDNSETSPTVNDLNTTQSPVQDSCPACEHEVQQTYSKDKSDRSDITENRDKSNSPKKADLKTKKDENDEQSMEFTTTTLKRANTSPEPVRNSKTKCADQASNETAKSKKKKKTK